VETRLVEARLQIIVAGPRADSVLSDVLERSLPEAPHLVEADGVALRREHRLGVGAWSLRGEATDLETISHRLEDAGAVPAALEAVTAVRIERGVAWFGVDFGEENFPQETGLEKQALSYSKGCYLGQEIVARIHYRGHVNRHVRGLLAPSSVRLQAGQELALGGEKVGAVASATWSPAMNASIGLAMLHRKAEPEAGVALASGELLRVVPLPFV
ncbi:MAG: hypothetical protein OEM62_04110, partial [Acidobacteriota bacterium]|nr:hypothetical protein [Acidobacteriota bacterium]